MTFTPDQIDQVVAIESAYIDRQINRELAIKELVEVGISFNGAVAMVDYLDRWE